MEISGRDFIEFPRARAERGHYACFPFHIRLHIQKLGYGVVKLFMKSSTMKGLLWCGGYTSVKSIKKRLNKNCEKTSKKTEKKTYGRN